MKENTPDEFARAYLNGKLSGPELDNFEKSLSSNPELAQALVFERAEVAASELLIASETRQLFEEWQRPRRQSGRNRAIAWIAGFAAVLALFFAAVWVWRQPSARPAIQSPETSPYPPAKRQTPTPEARQPSAGATPEKSAPQKSRAPDFRALASRYLPEPVLSNLRRSPADSVTSNFQRAQQAYAAGNYQQALEFLAQTDSSRLQAATYLSAYCRYHLGQFPEAETQFARLVDGNSRQYRYPGEWGLLMARLADFTHRKIEFRQQLNAILANPEHPYLEQAKALEKELIALGIL